MPKKKDLLWSGFHEIHRSIKSNGPLCDIAKKCLLSNPARSLAATQLCDVPERAISGIYESNLVLEVYG
jgi:hypothetical protein